MVLIGIILLSAGIYFQIKGMPTKGKPVAVIEQSEPVEMTEEGVVVEEATEEATEKATEDAASSKQPKEKKPATPIVLIIIGATGLLVGWNCSVKDAIRSAKKINISY